MNKIMKIRELQFSFLAQRSSRPAWGPAKKFSSSRRRSSHAGTDTSMQRSLMTHGIMRSMVEQNTDA